MQHNKHIRMHLQEYSFLLLFCIFIITTQSSCKKFVAIDPPSTSLATANVFDKNTTATAAQLAIYAQMQAYPQNIDAQTGLSSDELKNYSSNLTAVHLYTNTLNALNDADKVGVWKAAFNFIYQANAIIEALPNSPGVTDAVKSQLTGESKFVRAFWNFYLVNFYDDVPLVLNTDYTVNSKLPRTSKGDVYQQIITDLIDAQNALNSNYVDATDTTTTSERIRPTKWAATAFLARVYLCIGDFAKAEAAATPLINNTSAFSLPTDLNAVFLKNSTETIWQLQPNSNNKYTSEGSNFIITSNPLTSGGSYMSTISDQLMNTFEAGDNRKTKWIGSYTTTTAPIATYYFPYKYKAGTSSSSLTEYTMVLRLAEQYLIRAEARARQNNLSGAITDLDIIRKRAGLSLIANTNPTISQQALIDKILHERQVELFTEAHRWFDLKRTSTVDAVMSTITPQKGGAWNTNQQLYPIPITDIQNSAEIISQNNGY